MIQTVISFCAIFLILFVSCFFAVAWKAPSGFKSMTLQSGAMATVLTIVAGFVVGCSPEKPKTPPDQKPLFETGKPGPTVLTPSISTPEGPTLSSVVTEESPDEKNFQKSFVQAAEKGDFESLSKGFTHLPAPSKDLITDAAIEAAHEGRMKALSYLIDHGAEINRKPGEDIDHMNTMLTSAINGGHLEAVIYLLKKKADPNLRQGKYQFTPLFVAVSDGKMPVVKALVESGADIQADNGRMGTAITAAKSQGEYKIASYLSSRVGTLYVHASDGGYSDCTVLITESGQSETLITWVTDKKTYAINGKARDKAASHGWVDGKTRFNAQQMQQYLSEGLSKCR